MKKKIFLFVISFSCTFLYAQVVERQRPVEWMQLIKEGRMDRFLAMPSAVQAKDIVWGTDSVLNRYVDNGIESSVYMEFAMMMVDV